MASVCLLLACGAVQATLLNGKLMILGSSTAAGTGASLPAKSWAGQLAVWLEQYKNAQTRNLAVSGSLTSAALCADQRTTAAIRDKVGPIKGADLAIASGATHAILSFPSNDTMAGMSAQQTVNNLLEIRRCLTDAGVKVAVLSTLPRSGLSDGQRQTMTRIDQELRRALGRCFLDVHSMLADTAGVEPARTLSAGDGVHFNDRGHAVIYSAVRRFLESGECF
jgi:lysophospholipase L1-like esterase